MSWATVLQGNPKKHAGLTEKEWVAHYADRVEEYYVDWGALIDRRKWNRLGGGAQEEYEAQLKEKAKAPRYRAWKGDLYYPITKATYLWAKDRK